MHRIENQNFLVICKICGKISEITDARTMESRHLSFWEKVRLIFI
jgi:Fe2+ or Zn2+ uptake regulation protein